MPDALTVLAEDHRRVLELLAQLTGGAAGEPDGERERKAIAEQVAIAESKHEAIEELCFWPLVRSRLEHGEELAKQALEQEGTGKELIHDLDHLSAGDPEFATLVRRLQSAVQEHITFEEGQVWPQLRTAVSGSELAEVGDRMESARRTAPTRPYPKTPADPRFLGTVGPAVGAIDRTRDALSGRGHGGSPLGRWRVVLVTAGAGIPALAVVVWAIRRSSSAGGAGQRALRRARDTLAADEAALRRAGQTALRRASDTLVADEDLVRRAAGTALHQAGGALRADGGRRRARSLVRVVPAALTRVPSVLGRRLSAGFRADG